MNVDVYLTRINYTGPRESNLRNLNAIITAHKIALPFSNLRLGLTGDANSIKLDLNKIYDHVITEKGSGMCFELNSLFIWLLRQLGYDVFGVYSAVQFEEGLSRPEFHLTPMVRLGGEVYYVNAAMFIFGVFKVAHMEVTVTPFNVYRFREVPSATGSELVFERHAKTVLDARGNTLKEGPCATEYSDCRTNQQCQEEESQHWVRIIVISDMTSREMEDFVPILDDILADPMNSLRKRIILSRYQMEPVMCTHSVYGELYQKKRAVDPIIDQIVCSEELNSNDDVENIVKEVFRFNITHPVKYYKFVE